MDIISVDLHHDTVNGLLLLYYLPFVNEEGKAQHRASQTWKAC